jgi:hypothetical protein
MSTRRGRTLAVEEILESAMPPGFSERLRLEEAAEGWADVVGKVLAARSALSDLADGELLVVAETPLAASRLSMMGGGIVKTLRERFGLDVARIRVVAGRVPLPRNRGGGARNDEKRTRSPRAENGKEDEKKKDFARRCLESFPGLPEEAAESFAALRLFLARRFPSESRGKPADPRRGRP